MKIYGKFMVNLWEIILKEPFFRFGYMEEQLNLVNDKSITTEDLVTDLVKILYARGASINYIVRN